MDRKQGQAGLQDRLRLKYREWIKPDHSITLWLMRDIGVVYLANPKAASSSIRHFIRKRQGESLPPGLARHPALGKWMIQRLAKRIVTPRRAEGLCRQYFTFSFVRNPLSRLYSCYRDKVVNAATRRETCTLSPYGIHLGMNFDEFVECVAALPDRGADRHIRSQYTFLVNNGELLTDYLGKLERFGDDWCYLHDTFGLPQPERQRRVSGSAVAITELPYTRRSAELAVERYRRDIELFGYEDEVKRLLSVLGNS